MNLRSFQKVELHDYGEKRTKAKSWKEKVCL